MAVVMLLAVNLLLSSALGVSVSVSGRAPQPSTAGAPTRGEVDQEAVFQGDLQLQYELLRYQWAATAIIIAVLTVVSVILGWWLAGRVLRPIRNVTSTARRLSLSNLHQRIAMQGPDDELKELADTFDDMLDRLERSTDAQRRFAANASHELKTPLALDRALLQVAFGELPEELLEARDELLASNSRQHRLIDGLLMLAAAEHTLTNAEPVDLADLARRVLCEHPGATVDLSPALTSGDPVLVERLIANLVENAEKYNDQRRFIAVRTGTGNGGAVLTVENTGQEIAHEVVSSLFEPFRRLTSDRTESVSGAGLGLSIVAAITRVHGGTIDAVPRTGGGLAVTVRLPDMGSVLKAQLRFSTGGRG
ncbi:sensor histidine kinase [Nonomuraea sp. 10N515B]|uniref:sensor histidine kinase n=1 Tax=Nonomuraea sp. 10N515B TaxID=3457422 RepID=UPI003FCEB922